MLQLTPSAAEEIKRLQRSRQLTHHHFRLGVKAGGCAGWFYHLDFVTDIEDTDLEYESQGVTVLVDGPSAVYLNHLKLDYAEDLMGGGFRFTNPNAAQVCSCSLSFAPKLEQGL
ncbi:MAG: iron-sulfur cluster assembly accessory protein [Synechocystis sp.]|jgi:iron-sulfur cluster assembly accessory protein|nr:iron-sulfur cluster assembly accessory protein [Synechocystis sp.]